MKKVNNFLAFRIRNTVNHQHLLLQKCGFQLWHERYWRTNIWKTKMCHKFIYLFGTFTIIYLGSNFLLVWSTYLNNYLCILTQIYNTCSLLTLTWKRQKREKRKHCNTNIKVIWKKTSRCEDLEHISTYLFQDISIGHRFSLYPCTCWYDYKCFNLIKYINYCFSFSLNFLTAILHTELFTCLYLISSLLR